MKILLINPSQNKNTYGVERPEPYPPLGLLYIGAVLEELNHRVRLLDMDAEGFNTNKLSDFLDEWNPHLAGISISTPVYNQAMKTAEFIKKKMNIPIVVGGIHPTIDPESCISKDYIDFVIVGEGEITIKEFVTKLENNERNFLDIAGLYFKQNGKIIRNLDRELIKDIDTISFPARHLLKRPGAYIPPDALRRPVATIITSRGCPGRCTYCCTQQIFGRRFRARSVENIITEIEEIVREYKVKEIHIVDDVFTTNKKRALDFCREIKQKNLDLIFTFSNGLRADQVDKEILTALKDIGVVSVGYGVESGNEKILSNIKKDIKLDCVRETFRISKELGFQTWAFFMLGLPGETHETIRDTIDFAKEVDADFTKFLILKPFPGSPIFNELSNQGLITDFNYDHYSPYTPPVHHLPELRSNEILYWQKRAYREFYVRPSVILKHLFRIKTFSQFYCNIQSLLFILKKMVK